MKWLSKESKKNYITMLSSSYSLEHANQIVIWLSEKVTGKSFSYLLVHPELFTTQHEKELKIYIDRLVHDNYPLQYILEKVTFGDISILVEPPVLIPRPETEEWLYLVLDMLSCYKNEPLAILDLCTGSGCIAIAAGHYFKNSQVDAVDLYEKPLELTQKNIQLNKSHNVTVVKSDLFSELKGKEYDVIFTNPPYIDESVWRTLSLTVKKWEDKQALVADNKGLALYQKIIKELPQFLKKSSVIKDMPRFYTEIGYDQGNAVSKLLINVGLNSVQVHKDYAGKDRMVSACILKSV